MFHSKTGLLYLFLTSLLFIAIWAAGTPVHAAVDGNDDVTTGSNGTDAGNTVDVDWDAAASTPQAVGGGWVGTTVPNGDPIGSAPSNLNALSYSGSNGLGSLNALADSLAHLIVVPSGTTAQRTEDAAQSTIVLAGGNAWDFDFIDNDEDGNYEPGDGEVASHGYGVRVMGQLAQNGGGGGAIDIQETTDGIFIEVYTGGTITGNVTNSGNTNSILDISPENDTAGDVTSLVTGDYIGGTGNDQLVLEATSNSTGTSTARLDGNATLGTSTVFDVIDLAAEALGANATAEVTGALTVTGAGRMYVDAEANAGRTATVTIVGATTLGNSDDEVEFDLLTQDATATGLINLQANLDLGDGTNEVEVTGDSKSGSKLVFNTAADASGTTTDLLGGSGNDELTFTNMADGSLILDVDLATTAGGNDLITLDNANLTGNVSFGASTSNSLVAKGNSKISGTLTLGGPTTIDMQGASLSLAGAVAVDDNTQISRSVGTGILSGTGTVTVASGKTLTIDNAGILGTITGGLAGAGSVNLQAGTLNETNIALADTLNLNIASGADVSLTGDQTLVSLTGAGELNVNGNNLTLGTGNTNFTGRLMALGNLVVTGGTNQITSQLQLNNLTVSGGTLTLVGDLGVASGAARVLDIGAATVVQGDLLLDADTTIQGSAGLTLTANGDSPGEIDVDDGLTLTIADAARLTAAAGGLTGEGTVVLQSGTLSEASVPVGNELTLQIDAGGTVTLNADQQMTALNGAGTLDAGGNNLSLGTGDSTFTGTLSNLANLSLTGGTNAISSAMTLNNLSVEGTSATLTGDIAMAVGADRAIMINAPTQIAGDLLATENTTIGGTSTLTLTAGGSSGALNVAAGKTLTLSNADILSSAAGGFTGTGAVLIQSGTLAESDAALADGLSLTLASGAGTTLSGDQSLAALNGSGALNANGNNLTLTTGTSSFTGTLSNAKDLTFDGAGTHSLSLGSASLGETATNDAAITVDNGATVSLTGSGSAYTGDINVTNGSLMLDGSYSFGEDANSPAGMTVAATHSAKIMGTPTITGSIALSGTLETNTTSIGTTPITFNPGAKLRASGSTGLSLDAGGGSLDLSAIDADAEAVSLDATNGPVTVSDWTLPAIGGGTVTVNSTDTANKVKLANLTLNSAGAVNETLSIGTGKVYLTGNLNSGNAGDVVTAAAGATVVVDATDAGAGAVNTSGGGVLLYGPNASGVTYNLDSQTGVDSGDSGATINDPVAVNEAAVFGGGGEIDLANTVTVTPNAGNATLSVNEAGTKVKIRTLAGLGGGDTLNKDGDGELELAAPVPGNVSATGGTITLESGSSVGGDVQVTGAKLKLSGDAIAGDLAVDNATIEPGEDTELDDNMTVTNKMTVSGTKRLKVRGQTTVSNGSEVSPQAGATVELTDVSGIGVGESMKLSGGGTVEINDSGINAGGAGGGTVEVDGATLMGVGPIAGNLLLTSGSHSPGNSIGTQTVTGTYTLANGATLKVEIDAGAGQTADLVDVTGNAVLQSGSKVQVIQADGTIGTGDEFTVIKTTTGITNGGATVESLVSYDFSGAVVDMGGGAQNYVLTATSRPFVDLASGSNQTGLARALDAMGSNALTTALGNVPESQFSAAVAQLDAAPHLVSQGMAVPAVSTVNGHVAGRLAGLRTGNANLAYLQDSAVGLTFAQAAQDPRMLDQALEGVTTPAAKAYAQVEDPLEGTLLGWRPFVKTYGTFSQHDTTGEQTGYDANTVGFVAGIDRRFGEFTQVGLLTGYSFTDVDYDQSRGDADVHTLRVGPYATFDLENLFIDTSLTMGYHWNDATRKVRIGSFSGDAHSEYNAWDLALYGGVGYDFDVAGFTVTPTASLQWVHFEQESFRESGAGSANLDVDSWDTDSLRHVLALKVSRIFETEKATIVPELYMGWGHEYLEDEKISSKFVGQTTPFTFESDADNRDSMLFGAGVSFLFNENLSVFFRYDGDADSDETAHTVSAGLRIAF